MNAYIFFVCISNEVRVFFQAERAHAVESTKDNLTKKQKKVLQKQILVAISPSSTQISCAADNSFLLFWHTAGCMWAYRKALHSQKAFESIYSTFPVVFISKQKQKKGFKPFHLLCHLLKHFSPKRNMFLL